MMVHLSPRARTLLSRALACLLALSLIFTVPAAPSAATRAPGGAHNRTEIAAVPPSAPAPEAGQPVIADPPPVGAGNVLGAVLDAETDAPLVGVQVVMTGTAEPLPRNRLYLPMLMKNVRQGASASPAGAAPAGDTLTFSTTTGADGAFTLTAPAGAYLIDFTLPSYTFDKRSVQVKANQAQRVENVLLHRLDPVVKPIGAAGGAVTNSLSNTSLEFPPGALPTTQQTRVTYLGNDALPGEFADGSLPMGFASLEPEGLTFPPGKEVLWTVKYDGPLPVGTDTLCYWWDGKENRWRDPVPGKVVAVAGGKALQAKVSHFSNYGHAMPGVAGQQPGGGDSVAVPNTGKGACQTGCPGSTVNVGTGAVSESYAFPPVSSAGFPISLALQYSSDNDTATVTARVPFTITSQVPARAAWRLDFQGKEYTGAGYEARAEWDTRNGLGYRVAPGQYTFKAWETFYYDSGQQPTLTVNGGVDVRRGDISPFGFNWLSSYDTLLVNGSATATVIQGDGQYLTYTRGPNYAYTPGPGDVSQLERNPDGSWTRTSKYGMIETFNAQGRLTRIEDRNGTAQTLAYEPNGVTLPAGKWGLTERLTRITDAGGRGFTLTYGPDGYVARVTDPTGRAYQLAHDAAGNLTGITDPLGRVTAYSYANGHFLASYTYPEGNGASLAYDAQGRLITRTDSLGATRTAAYGPAGTTRTDERGATTTYTPNAYGAIEQVAGPRGVSKYTWDAQRHLVATDPPRTKLTYDSQGNLTAASTYARIGTEYDGQNQPVSYTDQSGHVTRFGYDARGNLTTLTDPLGNVHRFQYDAAGQVLAATDPLGQTNRFEYDGQGQLRKAVDPLGQATTLEYDASGNVTRLADAAGHGGAFTYDAAGRLTSVTNGLGGVVAFTWDRNDNLVRVTDENGRATNYAYDRADRQLSETDPLSRTTAYAYDAAGNRISRTNASGAAVQYTYDAANRIIGEQQPGANVTYAYDVTDNLTSYADPNVQITHKYVTGIPAQPDVVDTDFIGQPQLHNTVSYDYVELSGAQSAAADVPDGEPNATPEPVAAPAVPAPAVPAPAVPAPAVQPSAALRLADLPPFPAAPTGVATNGCGNISTDTTWTLANSPYVMDGCSAYVYQGATLTIQPGVILKFGSTWDMLRVDGRLLAQGTAAQPILLTSLDDDTGGDTNGNGNATKPTPGDWNGLHFRETSTGSALDHIVIRYGGADGMSTALYAYIATFTMANSIIAQTKGHGMYFETTMPASLTNNSFLDNTLTAGTVILNAAGPSITMSGNTATGNGVNGLRVVSQFKGNGVWTGDPGFPFVMQNGNLQVLAGSTLTLTPGTIVKLGDYVWDSLEVWGTLVAQGTAQQPIYFTSLCDDSVGGDTNNDGNTKPAAPGQWNGIVFKDTSTGSLLDHAIIRYGGSYVNTAAVQSNTPNFTLTNSTISLTRGYGLYMDGGLPAVLSNNTFSGNTQAAVRAYFNYIGSSIQLTGNQVTGNGLNGFQVVGVLNADSTFAGQPDFAFSITDGNLQVQPGAKLTLKPGTVVKVENAFAGLFVYGALDSQGTEGQPVYFTSLRDDTAGGDTNNDGAASQPAPGDWMHIFFSNSSEQSTLSHTVIRYAGGTGWKLAIRSYRSALTLDGCTITHTSGGGLGVESASPTVQNTLFLENEYGLIVWGTAAQPALSGNRFVGNTLSAVRNDSPGVILDATGSWWGGSNGPLDPSDDRAGGGWYNPQGDGDRVTDRVKYAPWQVVTGLLYGLTVATGNNPAQTVRYAYNALSQVSELRATGPANLNYRFGYDAAARLTSVGPASGAAGVSATYGYDAASRLTHLTSGSAGVTIIDAVYAFDAADNITSVTDRSGTTAYTYDAGSRLTAINAPGLSESYAYDPAGNRTRKGALTYTYDAADQLTASSDGTTYTYDANGNLATKSVGGQTTTYTWDVHNRLVQIDHGGGQYSAYTYDNLGHRLSKRDRAGNMTYYIYDGLNLVQEVDANGAVLANYVYAGLDFPLSMTRDGVTYYYMLDHLHSVVGLVNSAGQLVAGYRYDPWGNVIATSGSNPSLVNPLRYTGQVWDAESGLVYLRARYYDPQAGRFISRDPARLSLMGKNAYAYAADNPVNVSDTLGLIGEGGRRVLQVLGGVAVGLVAGAIVVGSGGLGAPAAAGLLLQAGVVGTAAGAATGAVIEATATPCNEKPNYWKALGYGGFGGLVGSLAAGFTGILLPEYAGSYAGSYGVKSVTETGRAVWEIGSKFAQGKWLMTPARLVGGKVVGGQWLPGYVIAGWGLSLASGGVLVLAGLNVLRVLMFE